MNNEKNISVFELACLIAFDSVLSPDEEFVHRFYARKYSKAFHVPLPEAMELPLLHVMLNCIEDDAFTRYNSDKNEFCRELLSTYSPDYEEKNNEELDSIMEMHDLSKAQKNNEKTEHKEPEIKTEENRENIIKSEPAIKTGDEKVVFSKKYDEPSTSDFLDTLSSDSGNLFDIDD